MSAAHGSSCATGSPIRIEVAYAGPEGQALIAVTVPAGTPVVEAVGRSGLVERLGLFEAALSYAIHGQRAEAQTPLRDGDRVELLRPLVADPKEARRQRAQAHPLSRVRPRRR